MIKKNKENFTDNDCFHNNDCKNLIDTSYTCRQLVTSQGCTEDIKKKCNKTCSILNKTCDGLPECKDIESKQVCDKLKKDGCICRLGTI